MMLVANNKQKCIETTDEENNLFGIDKLKLKRSTIPASPCRLFNE